MTRKGGGRESGGVRELTDGKAGSTPAAANPAAHSHPSDCPCVRLHERIRELKAELARCNEGAENWHNEADTTHEYLKAAYARAERAEARVKEADAVIAKLSEGGVNWIDGAYRGFHLQKALHARESCISHAGTGRSP